MSARLIAAMATYFLLCACSSSELTGSNGKKTTKPKPTPVAGSVTEPLSQERGEDDDKKETKKPVRKPAEKTPDEDDEDQDVPEKAITAGSFTVWTVPSDPAPYQDYWVYIQVKLPSTIKTITMSDLSGRLIGTDTYQQAIGRSAFGTFDEAAQQFKQKGRRAILRLRVPGSFQSVQDNIDVHSAALNEQQNISIIF
jgi:hypothetical protein